MKEINVPWSVVRKTVHLGYDYIFDEPAQFDFICNIPLKELSDLYTYSLVQKQYLEKKKFYKPINEIDWSDQVKLLVVELQFREENNL